MGETLRTVSSMRRELYFLKEAREIILRRRGYTVEAIKLSMPLYQEIIELSNEIERRSYDEV